MKNKAEVLRPVDDHAIQLARTLIVDAKFASLAVLDPKDGYPLVSRVGVVSDPHGCPVFLGSDISTHASAVAADGRCSLMLGEPGRGDPLAHPRITVVGTAERLDRHSDQHRQVRARYLENHPKAKLYVDFADFAFYRIAVQRADLNGGFGKAYLLRSADLLEPRR